MKKAQITMVILVGLVLLVLIGLLLYLSKSSILNRTEQSTQNVQETLEDVSFKDHVQQCLDKTTKESIKFLAAQGGYIYSTQGGPQFDHQQSDLGVMYVNYQGYKVNYNIKTANIDTQLFSSVLPVYPWYYFPYTYQNSVVERYEGVFGKPTIPPLTFAGGAGSVQSQIETSIENNIKNCIDVNIFKERGFSVLMENPDVTLTIANKDINVRMALPTILTNDQTGEISTLKEFSGKYDIRLKELYLFIQDILNDDTHDIQFDIMDPSNNKDNFMIQSTKDVFESDDIIKITDYISLIEGKPLEYIFARKNRPAALYFIKNEEVVLPYGHMIMESDVLSGETLRSKDPDEDQVNFRIKLNGDVFVGPLEFERTEETFVIDVTDGKYTDYQLVKITRSP